MNRLTQKRNSADRRSSRVRAKMHGTTERPRLSVHISNLHVSAQIINDDTSKTVVYATTVGQKKATGTMTERAAWVGGEIAKKAKAAKIDKVVFDRGTKQYHGRIKALADAAREGGLEF